MGKRDDSGREFSLVRGGPSFHVARALRLSAESGPQTTRACLVAAATAWLPLLVLAIPQGVAYGDRVTIPLLHDLTTFARHWVAIPLLIAAEALIDQRLAVAVRAFTSRGLVGPAALPDLDRALETVRRGRDAWLPELLMLGAAFAWGWIRLGGFGMNDVTTWAALGSPPQPTWAGLWFAFVSLPLFAFLILRWGWRLLLWTGFLWRVSRLKLDLLPAHPDGAGGIGFVGVAHEGFNMLVMALAVVFSAGAAQWIVYGGLAPEGLKAPIAAFVILAWLMFQGPVLVFLPALFAAKLRGIRQYDELAQSYTRSFDDKWITPERKSEELLGSSDIQSLADLGGSYERIRRMRPVPIDIRQLVSLVLAAVLPMVPLLATAIPLQVILSKLLAILGR